MFNKQTSKTEIIKCGIAAGFLECVYVFLVILFFNTMEDSGQKMDSLTGGLFMLLFFVLSVLISGVLVFGQPIILVLKGKISQAVSVFFVSLATISAVFIIVAVITIL